MENMPCDLCSPGLKGRNYQRERNRYAKRNRCGEKFQRIRGKKSKVIGKRRQEAFSGRSEKTGNKEGSQDSRARAWSTSKSLRLVQGTASSLRGSKKVSIWSTWLILWLWLRP